MKHIKLTVATLVLALGAVAFSTAQSQIDKNADILALQGGQGGQRGQGGPGGMQRGGSPLALFQDPKVRDHLKITDQQFQALQEALRPQGGPQGQGGQRGQGGQGGQQGQRGQGGAGFDPAARQAETDAKVKAILNQQQYTRYKQLELQQQGATAVTRPDIAQQLGLSEAQKTKIQQILEANRPQGGPGGGQGGFGGGGQRGQGGQGGQQGQGGQRGQGGAGFDPAAMQAQREKTEKEVLAVLTDAQRQKWQSLLGAKFEFSPPPAGGPGGPGGARGNGGTQA